MIDKEFNKKMMLYNLKMMNAHLDWILSGEWRKANGNDSERLYREKDERDTLQ